MDPRAPGHISDALIAKVELAKAKTLRDLRKRPSTVSPALYDSFKNTRESYNVGVSKPRRSGSPAPGPSSTPWSPPARVRSMSSPGPRGSGQSVSGGRPLQKRINNDNTASPQPKRSRAGEEGPGEKPNWKQLKQEKKELKAERQISEKGLEIYNIRRDAKALWEDLRRKDCPSQRKAELARALFDLIKGHLTPFALTHDMSRIIETLMVDGTTEMREAVIQCYKTMPRMAWMKYSNHVIVKALRHATIEQKKFVYNFYRQHFMYLMAEPYGRELGELIFDGIDREDYRLSFISCAFGQSYSVFRTVNKGVEYMTAKEWITSHPLMKNELLAHFKFALNKMLNRVGPIPLKNHPLHALLTQYFEICSPEDKNEMLELTKFRDNILEVLPTKSGAPLVMQIFWDSTAKDRKNMVKSLKGKICEIGCKQYGHLVLLGILDSLDDTSLAKKAVIIELIRSVIVLMGNSYGRKVIRYLVDPRNRMDFTPDLIAILAKGDQNPYSKKDMAIRRLEILNAVKDDLLDAVIEHAEPWVRSGNSALVVTSILLKCDGPKTEQAMSEIVRLITHKQPFECIHNGGTFLMVKKLIGHEGRLLVVNEGSTTLPISPKRTTDRETLNTKFVNLLIESFTKKSMENWLESPQGSALIYAIFEAFSRNRQMLKDLFQKIMLCDYVTILEKEQESVRSKGNLLTLLRKNSAFMAAE